MRTVERSAVHARAGERIARVAAQDVGPPGHVVTLAWAGAVGATDVEVTQAALILDTASVVRDQPGLPVAVAGNSADITIPAHERVRSLTLDGLSSDGSTELLDEAALSVAGLRLTVSLSSGGAFSPPVHAAPAVSGGQMLPPVLGGASYASGVLSLHDVAASRVRLNLANGDTPVEFVPQPLQLAGASGVTVLPTRGLAVTGPDGKSVFAVPDELPDVRGGHEVDLKPALKQAFAAALASGAPLQAAFTVQGEAGCRAFVSTSGPHGALLRVESGVLRTEVNGAPAPLLLAGPLDAHAPGAARADLTVKYLGLRVVAEVSDAVPPSGGAHGIVVREAPVLRAVPTGALAGLPLARVGIIGRAPEACELSLQLCEDSAGATSPAVLSGAAGAAGAGGAASTASTASAGGAVGTGAVTAAGGLPGKALGKPGTLKLKPSPDAGARLECHWIELPPLPESALRSGRLALALRVTSGRFLWAAGAGAPGQPLVRLAVRDPDPGGRALRLGSHVLLTLHESSADLKDFTFPQALFARGAGGTGGPLFDSDLFLTVDVSDLTLRYAR